jgi:hypothetical protein
MPLTKISIHLHENYGFVVFGWAKVKLLADKIG